MVLNPKKVKFTSDNHNSLNPDGSPKITHYAFGVFPTATPSGNPSLIFTYPKGDMVDVGNSEYETPNISTPLGSTYGYLFVRGEGGIQGPAAWGTGMQFQSGVTPVAPSNVVALIP